MLLLRDGFVTEEFIDLARTESRTAEQESRLDELKAQLRANASWRTRCRGLRHRETVVMQGKCERRPSLITVSTREA